MNFINRKPRENKTAKYDFEPGALFAMSAIRPSSCYTIVAVDTKINGSGHSSQTAVTDRSPTHAIHNFHYKKHIAKRHRSLPLRFSLSIDTELLIQVCFPALFFYIFRLFQSANGLCSIPRFIIEMCFLLLPYFALIGTKNL